MICEGDKVICTDFDVFLMVRNCHSMSLTWNNCSFAKPLLQAALNSQSEDALQLLLRHRSQLATDDSCDKASLDRVKTLLRVLISNEGRHLSTGCAVESPSQASMLAAARRVDLRRYRTELCRSYAETGHCRYGVHCQQDARLGCFVTIHERCRRK